jgi:thiamine-phosphate pyrophosphorylase
MILCLVTDRRRLGGTFEAVVDQARAAVAAGVDLLQIRERDLEAADLAVLTSRIVHAARGTETRVVVNDRLDVALASGAHGVHLRGDSMAPSVVRQIAPRPFLIGRSVHTIAEARAAGGADYLIAGTVFHTSSKREVARLLGVDGLRAIVAATDVPVLAIGGITTGNLAGIAAAGAAGAAAIGLLTVCQTAAMRELVDAARGSFASGGSPAANRPSHVVGPVDLSLR